MNYSRNKYVISLVIPVITAVSFTFMGIFGLMFERYKTFNHTTVLYLALCIITFAIDIYLYKALYNDTINFLEDTEVYLQFLRFGMPTISVRDNLKKCDLDDSVFKEIPVKSVLFKEVPLPYILKIFNDTVMPNIMILSNPDVIGDFGYFYLFTGSLNEKEITDINNVISEYGNDSISIINDTGYVNITNLMRTLIGIRFDIYSVAIEYDEAKNISQLVIIENPNTDSDGDENV